MLVLLEKRRLVQRDTHPTDGRARTVFLTAAGKRKFRQLWTAGESIRQEILDHLKPGEAETLVTLLTKVAESLSVDGVRVGRPNPFHSQKDET
jgi:DNA-binding MarR family transcriptional regulator